MQNFGPRHDTPVSQASFAVDGLGTVTSDHLLPFHRSISGSRGDGYLHGNGYVVTWAVGHLAALAQPHEINPEWRLWRRDLLPILPNRWPLVVYEKTKVQFEIVRKILGSPRISRVVCATDAGREGELIFRGTGTVEFVCAQLWRA